MAVSSPPPVAIVVDDTDPTIQYFGNWITDHGSLDEVGIQLNGPEYNHTLHGTTGNGGVKYIFNGTRVTVFGTIESIQRAPLWLCTIDTTLTVNSPPLKDYLIANQFLLCDFPDLVSGSHTLVITPFFNTSNSKFWLDYIAYVPSSLPEDIPASSVIKVQDDDEDVKYSGNWVGFGFPDGSADVTQTFEAGSFCTYTFNGTSISLYGFFDTFVPPLTSAPATYSIDGGPTTDFTIKAGDAFNVTETVAGINELIFTSPDLQPGTHTINITYNGNQSNVPLVVDYFYVVTNPSSSSDSSIPSSASISSPSTPSTSTNSAATVDSVHKVLDHGVIIGVVLGGTFMLIAIVAAVVWWLRYQKRKRNQVYDARLNRGFDVEPLRPPHWSINLTSPSMTEASSSQHSALSPVLSPLSPSSGFPIGMTSPTILQHKDSGIRMAPGDEEAEIVNIPPGYSRS